MQGHYVHGVMSSDVSFDPEDLLLAAYSLNVLTGNGEKKPLWELNDATSHTRSQAVHESSGAAPYLESPNVLFLCRITQRAAAEVTHEATMYREHMAVGIRPQGFASEGPASDAFDILGGRKPVSHRQGFGLRSRDFS